MSDNLFCEGVKFVEGKTIIKNHNNSRKGKGIFLFISLHAMYCILVCVLLSVYVEIFIYGLSK